ncbi:MAG: ABC transporter permease [Deltaproteobacteria bacterium]|jgi:spermidine/putrescine transport system permease protein|nr:ABC transporter permease [Deltaproteobacteria bacterium]
MTESTGRKARKMISWRGDVRDARELRLAGLALAGPPLVWLATLLALPCAALALVALAARGPYGQIVWSFSAANFKRLLGYGLFGWSPDFLLILLRSLEVALVTTVVCVLLAYPLTFHIACRPRKARVWWLTLIIVPFWTNVVVRTYAWLLLLSPQLPPAKLAAWAGFVPPGGALYPSELAVYLGMVSTFLPFMALPLYASVERLDWDLLEAARDLYAGRWTVFRQAILPQTLPGLSVGLVMTFVPAMAMFVVSDILGGAKQMLVGNLIQLQFGQARDWPFGAMLSMALMIMTLASLALCRRRPKNL